MKDFKLIIFDVDGTMLDTSKGLMSSAQYTIETLGYGIPSVDVLKSFVGPRIQDSLNRVYGLEGEELKGASSIFRNHYKEGDVLEAEPYDGLYEVLEWLKSNGYYIMVATNKRQDFVDALMLKFDLLRYLDGAFGTDVAGKLKKVDLIRMCMEKYPDINLDQVVMIGDSEYDAEGAEEAGIDFIGVTYGFGYDEISAKASKIKYISKINSLIQVLT